MGRHHLRGGGRSLAPAVRGVRLRSVSGLSGIFLSYRMTRDSDLYGLSVTDLSGFLTTTEAAKIIGVDSKTLVRWANHNKIPYHRTLGGHRRFRLQDVLRVIDPDNGFGAKDGKSRPVAP